MEKGYERLLIQKMLPTTRKKNERPPSSPLLHLADPKSTVDR